MPREVTSAGSYLPLLSSAPLLHMYPPEPKNLHSIAIQPPYSKQDLSKCQICRCPVGDLQTQTLPGSAVSIRPQTSRTVIFMLACTRCASCSKVGSCSPSCCTVGDALVSGPYMACSKARQFCEPQESVEQWEDHSALCKTLCSSRAPVQPLCIVSQHKP